tara:strand:+ start:1957 stop:2178 length:222 start_codon:yes stop_codon:yes gene_type:complete
MNDYDYMTQWRAGNRSGNGYAFGGDDDITIEDACHTEGATLLYELDTPNTYLVEKDGDEIVVCDAHGWWAVTV